MLQALQIPLFSHSYYNNRKSMPDHIFSKRLTERQRQKNKQRESIKIKYNQIIKKRHLSLQVGELNQSSINKVSGMPSIRKVREDRKKISEKLMETVCKYNHQLVAEERKKKMFMLKKNKYEKIKIIRQNHQRESMENSRLKIMGEKQIKNEKTKLKNIIKKDKQSASLAVIHCQQQKKSIGVKVRESSFIMREKRKSQKQILLSMKKKLTQQVKEEEQKLKEQKKINFEKCKTDGIKNYLTKLVKQLDSKKSVSNVNMKTEEKLSKQTGKLEKLKLKFDGKIRQFQSLLKETNPNVKKKSSIINQRKSCSTDFTKSNSN